MRKGRRGEGQGGGGEKGRGGKGEGEGRGEVTKSVRNEPATFPGQTSEFQHRNRSTVNSCFCFNCESTMGCCASKQAIEMSPPTKERRQEPPASTSDTFMNTVHPSCGTDNESVRLVGHSPSCAQTSWTRSDNRVDVKDLLKKLRTVLTFGSPSTIVAQTQAQRRGCGGPVEEEFWRTPGLRQSRVVDCGVFQQVQFVVRRCGLQHHQCHQAGYCATAPRGIFQMNWRSSRDCAPPEEPSQPCVS